MSTLPQSPGQRIRIPLSPDYEKTRTTIARVFGMLMTEADLTGQDVADKAGMSRQYVNQIICGGTMTLKTVLKIFNILGFKVSVLLERIEDEPRKAKRK